MYVPLPHCRLGVSRWEDSRNGWRDIFSPFFTQRKTSGPVITLSQVSGFVAGMKKEQSSACPYLRSSVHRAYPVRSSMYLSATR
jgi:hypothetical protein